MARKIIKDEANKYLDSYEEKAKHEWKKLVDKYVIEKALVDNQVFLTADQNWMSFTLRYVTDFKLRRKSKDVLFQNILQAIDAHSDQVRIASSAMEITGTEDFFKALNKPLAKGITTP